MNRQNELAVSKNFLVKTRDIIINTIREISPLDIKAMPPVDIYNKLVSKYQSDSNFIGGVMRLLAPRNGTATEPEIKKFVNPYLQETFVLMRADKFNKAVPEQSKIDKGRAFIDSMFHDSRFDFNATGEDGEVRPTSNGTNSNVITIEPPTKNKMTYTVLSTMPPTKGPTNIDTIVFLIPPISNVKTIKIDSLIVPQIPGDYPQVLAQVNELSGVIRGSQESGSTFVNIENSFPLINKDPVEGKSKIFFPSGKIELMYDAWSPTDKNAMTFRLMEINNTPIRVPCQNLPKISSIFYNPLDGSVTIGFSGDHFFSVSNYRFRFYYPPSAGVQSTKDLYLTDYGPNGEVLSRKLIFTKKFSGLSAIFNGGKDFNCTADGIDKLILIPNDPINYLCTYEAKVLTMVYEDWKRFLIQNKTEISAGVISTAVTSDTDILHITDIPCNYILNGYTPVKVMVDEVLPIGNLDYSVTGTDQASSGDAPASEILNLITVQSLTNVATLSFTVGM